MSENTTYLTTEEVSERLRVNTQSVLRWIRDGKMNAAKIGVRYLVPVEEYQRFVTDRQNIKED